MDNDNMNVLEQNLTAEELSEGILPIPFKDRIVTPMGFSMIYWASFIAVQLMTMGLFLLAPIGQLNFIQVMVACVISGVIFALVLAGNADAGARYGIPFVVQIRSAFGVKGAKYMGLARSIPAFVWNGIATWYGATALNVVTTTIFGWGNPYLYYAILMVIECILAVSGFKTVAWFDKFMSIVIFGLLLYFFIVLLGTGQIDFTEAKAVKGSWGLPFFFACMTGVAHMSAVVLNGSDIARQVNFGTDKTASGKNVFFTILGSLPPWIAMFLVGILIGIATGATDPITGLSEIAPSPAFAILLMIFLVLAQVTTNLSLNLVIAAYVFRDVFKWNWKVCCIVVCIVSSIILPWKLATSANFNNIMNTFSMFMGPAAAVMIADYFVIRKRKLNLDKLYDHTAYYYKNGWNMPAWICLVIGWIAAVLVPTLAWFVGFGVTFVLYVIAKKIMNIQTDLDEL